MKIFRILFKTFIVLILISLILTAGVAVFVAYRWKPMVEQFLSDTLGVGIKFSGVAVNLEEYSLTVRDLKVLSGKGFERHTFFGERCTLMIDKNIFDEEQRIFVKEMIIERGVLNLERNSKGAWNIDRADFSKADYGRGTAYAARAGEDAPLYTFVNSIKKISIRDSQILFKDKHVPMGLFEMAFYDFDFEFDSEKEFESVYGYIPIKVEMDFTIENNQYRDSEIHLEANIAAYKGKTDMDAAITTSYIDLMQFLPYFDSYTPFSFQNGLFSSTTELSFKDNMIDSLTTMIFHKLKLLIDEGMENADFLKTSVNRLAPYLMSRGEIVFDFVIKGPVDNLKAGIGPRVKYAMGIIAIEEFNKVIKTLR